jgi:hypothetical protein
MKLTGNLFLHQLISRLVAGGKSLAINVVILISFPA